MGTVTSIRSRSLAVANCRRGHFIRGTWAGDVRGGWLYCPCGSSGVALDFKARKSNRECGEVCTGASGPSCSCKCGGENHGGGRAFPG